MEMYGQFIVMRQAYWEQQIPVIAFQFDISRQRQAFLLFIGRGSSDRAQWEGGLQSRTEAVCVFAVTGDSVVQIKIDNVIVDEHIVVVLYAWRIKQFDEDALLHDVLSFCVLYQYVLMWTGQPEAVVRDGYHRMSIPDVRQNGIQLLEGDNLPGDVVIGIEAVGTGKDDTSSHFHYLDRADDIFRA